MSELEHPLVDHDFLDNDHEILELRRQRRQQMENIESEPEAYIKKIQEERAIQDSKLLLNKLINKTQNNNCDEDDENDENDDEELIEEEIVEEELIEDTDALYDDVEELVEVPKSTVINIKNVKNLTIKFF